MTTNRPQQGLNADFSVRAWRVNGDLWVLENEEAWGDGDAFILVRQVHDDEEGISTIQDLAYLTKQEAEGMLK